MARVSRLTNRLHAGGCNGSDRAIDWDGLAKIQSFRLSVDIRPSAVAMECGCFRNARSSRPCAHPARAAHQGPGSGATPMRSIGCLLVENENRLAILREKSSPLFR